MDIFFFSQLDPISPHQPQQLTKRPHQWSQEIAVRDGRIVLKVLQENKPPKYLKQKAFIPGIGNLVMKEPRHKREETQRLPTAGSCHHHPQGQREEMGFLESGPRSFDGKCPIRTGAIKETQPLLSNLGREVPCPLLSSRPPTSHQCLLLA